MQPILHVCVWGSCLLLSSRAGLRALPALCCQMGVCPHGVHLTWVRPGIWAGPLWQWCNQGYFNYKGWPQKKVQLSPCAPCTTVHLLEWFLSTDNSPKGACTGKHCQPGASWVDCHVSWGRGGRKEGTLGQAAWLRDGERFQAPCSAKCPARYSHEH